MKKVFMIGNTHFDPVWLWKWDEAMSSITATFRSALERMEEYPEFKYSFATPPVFEWIKKTSPKMFEEIKKRVAEGRWELAEGWWVQPDCYSAAGESYVRQGLYGQKYLMENFGKYADTVFNIDSFGHSPMLPQILSKSGIKYYVMCRPEKRHINLDAPFFNWKSADGSCVLSYRDDKPYRNDIASFIDEAKDNLNDTLMVYGVTDHGGAPTIKAINEIKERENAVFATCKEFFENRKTDYTVETEFITGDFGPYSNHTGIKALNRIAEYAVLNAEKASVICGEYDKEALRKCWQDVLFNQFHDILGGASIKDAYFDAYNMLGRAISTANEITHFNLLKVTNNINMPGKNPDNVWNIVVWNLNMHPYDGYIEAETQWVHEFPWYDKDIVLEDSDGKKYECQIIREKSVIPAFRSRFVFRAEIPSLGYKAFKVVQTGADIPQKKFEFANEAETERYKVSFCEASKQIKSVYDKKENREICSKLLYPVCFEDDGDTWAFNTTGYGRECEPFELIKTDVIECGKLRTVIKSTYSFRESKLEMYYTLYENESYIDVKYRVNWNEKHLALKIVTELEENVHRVSVPYGSIKRGETRADVPMGEWLETENISFVANHIFAYNLENNKLGFTVLRSPIYGDLRINEIDLDTDYDIMEQGINEGDIRVLLGGNVPVEEMSILFNNPPVVLCEANHKGELASCGSYFDVKAESTALTVIKKSEDDESIILRGVEYGGKKQKIKLKVLSNQFELDVEPFEIFTVKVNGREVSKVNMLENQ